MKKILFLFALCLFFAGSVPAQVIGQNLIIEVNSSRAGDFAASPLTLGDVSFSIEPLFSDRTGRKNWFIVHPDRSGNESAWDLAHRLVNENPDVLYAEPDQVQIRSYYRQVMDIDTFGENVYDPDWSHPKSAVFAWHLGKDHSQLKKARESVEVKGRRVRVAHFDTGYDPTHVSRPQFLLTSLQKNFVKGEDENCAVDPGKKGFGEQPGHGTGTLGILAGNQIEQSQYKFKDYVGGAPFAEIVPVRLSRTVILVQTSNLVKALYYVQQPDVKCDVVSMSMGGVASKYWAEAVNDAYDKGIVIVTAAGNNFGDLPTRYTVYPARFKRVISVCGATFDKSPYHKEDMFSGKMQGNYGPAGVMQHAMAAYTPNMPWARLKKIDSFGMRGGGTSSATPQVAAAAALWVQKYMEFKYQHPWQRVNATQYALFTSADKTFKDWKKFYGNGILRAFDALNIAPKIDAQPIPKDKVWCPYLTLLFGWEDDRGSETQTMFAVEMERLIQCNKELQKALADIDLEKPLSYEQKTRIRDAVLAVPERSNALAKQMRKIE